MIETRIKKIKDIIVNKNNLRTIFDFIKTQYEYSQEQKNHSLISCRLLCSDDSTFESDTNELLNDRDIIDLKKCKKIIFSYTDYKLDRNITLSIEHDDRYGYSDFTVRGNDRDWVNGKFNKLIEIIDSFEKQNGIIVKYKTIFLHFSALSFGIIAYWFINLFLIWFSGNDCEKLNEKGQTICDFFVNHINIKYLIIILMIWGVGLLFAQPFRGWFYKKFFPVIEFDFGPEHTKIEKNRRVQLFTIISLIFLPFLLAIFYDLIKDFIFK